MALVTRGELWARSRCSSPCHVVSGSPTLSRTTYVIPSLHLITEILSSHIITGSAGAAQ